MRRIAYVALLLALGLCLLLCVVAGAAPDLAQCACEQRIPPMPPSVRVCILVYANSSVGPLADHPFVSVGPEPSVRMQALITPSLQGLQLYTDAMAARGNILPLSDNTTTRLELQYFNQGFVNWDDASAYSRVLPSLIGADGVWSRLVNTSHPLRPAEWGGECTFIIHSVATPDSALSYLQNLCEDSNSCITIAPFHTGRNVFSCSATESSPGGDCYRRGRLIGARRFSNSLGVMANPDSNIGGVLELHHQFGVRRIAQISQALSRGSNYYIEAMASEALLAEQLGETVVYSVMMESVVVNGVERHVFPNNQSALSVARELADLNPDAMIMHIGTNPASYATLLELFTAFRREDIDWTPKGFAWSGGGESVMPFYTTDTDWVAWSLSGSLFDYRRKAPWCKNYLTPTNFELFPATTLKDAPQVFAESFNAKFAGDGKGFDFSRGGASYVPLGGYQALTIAQKLLELARTAHVPSLQIASTRLSVPSAYTQMEFDVNGQERFLDPVILQFIPKPEHAAGTSPFELAIIVPYNIGQPYVFPAPTWKERVFAPRFYASANEQILVSITAILLLACAFLLCAIVQYRRHASIAAASPLFCCLVVCGCMLMLSSNFFETLHVNDAHCAAQIWLLTCGFSLTFGALFIKTARVAVLLSSKKLQAVKLPESQLLAAVGAVLASDVLINGLWAGVAGMQSEIIVTDPIRPMFNFARCAYGPQRLGFVFAHIAVKCTLLLCGVVLAWKVRKAPSLFSESTWISLCIYNVSIIIGFILPILAAQLGGRRVTYLIRGGAICFLALTTCTLLFAPKLLSSKAKRKAAAAARFQHTSQPTPHLPPQSDVARMHELGAAGEAAAPDNAVKSFHGVIQSHPGDSQLKHRKYAAQRYSHEPGGVVDSHSSSSSLVEMVPSSDYSQLAVPGHAGAAAGGLVAISAVPPTPDTSLLDLNTPHVPSALPPDASNDRTQSSLRPSLPLGLSPTPTSHDQDSRDSVQSSSVVVHLAPLAFS